MPVRCPLIRCGLENDTPVSICSGCGADLRAYAAALRLPDLCYNRGLTLAKAGELALARTELQACLYSRPQDEEAALVYAKVTLALGSRQEARQLLTQLSKTTTDVEIARQAKACLEACRRYGAKKAKRKK